MTEDPRISETRDDFADVAAGLASGLLGAAAAITGVAFAILNGFWPGWIVAAAGLATIYYGLWILTR